jgi:uncharacterized MAPEG superfamily protein
MEITVLCILSVLYLLAFFPSSVGKLKFYGKEWVAGNRSLKEGQRPFSEFDHWGARSERAYQNLQTNYPPFAVAVILITFLNLSNDWTMTLCWVYLIVRILHFISYAYGVVAPRALFWGIGWLINIGLLIYVALNV